MRGNKIRDYNDFHFVSNKNISKKMLAFIRAISLLVTIKEK